MVGGGSRADWGWSGGEGGGRGVVEGGETAGGGGVGEGLVGKEGCVGD